MHNCEICGHPLCKIKETIHCLYCGWSDAPITPPEPARKFIIDSNAEIARLAQKNLKNNLDASFDYAQKRGLSESTIKKWQLGYIPAGFNRLKPMWERRILFPIKDADGKNIIGFGGRKITPDDRPKYVNSPASTEYDKSRTLYGFWFLPDKTEVIYLCEGYVDVLSMDTKGYDYPVASLGTSLTKEQAAMIRNKTNKVIIAYDSDDAGKKATVRAVEILHKAGFGYNEINVLFVDGAKDVDEALQHGGTLSEFSLYEYFLKIKDYPSAARTLIE